MQYSSSTTGMMTYSPYCRHELSSEEIADEMKLADELEAHVGKAGARWRSHRDSSQLEIVEFPLKSTMTSQIAAMSKKGSEMW